MKYTTKIYSASLILIITLIFSILSSEAQKIPLTQLSTTLGATEDAAYLLDTGEHDTSMIWSNSAAKLQ